MISLNLSNLGSEQQTRLANDQPQNHGSVRCPNQDVMILYALGRIFIRSEPAHYLAITAMPLKAVTQDYVFK